MYTYEPHEFTKKVLHWYYCRKCGLVYLNNEFTAWAVKKGCNDKDHPDYEKMRKGKK